MQQSLICFPEKERAEFRTQVNVVNAQDEIKFSSHINILKRHTINSDIFVELPEDKVEIEEEEIEPEERFG